MAAKTKNKRDRTGNAMPIDRVRQRTAHRASGASGTHSDANARRDAPGTHRTNRVGSRSARRTAAVRDFA